MENTPRNTDHSGLTDTLLMIRPAHFGFNEETASSNQFQTMDSLLSADEISRRAQFEFDTFRSRLEQAGINVVTYDDSTGVVTPDAVFPNNWISTHRDGTIVLYPMEGLNRRKERRADIVNDLKHRFGFHREIDLSPAEHQGEYLEGTGSMILDRAHRIIYACKSSRTHLKLVHQFAEALGYKNVVSFDAVMNAQSESSKPGAIYHTNVMMALGKRSVVICLESIPDDAERNAIEKAVLSTGREIVRITPSQVLEFAGNMLEVVSRTGQHYWILSDRARASLTRQQIGQLTAHGEQFLSTPLDTIEQIGGGSARCMLAEVFLPS